MTFGERLQIDHPDDYTIDVNIMSLNRELEKELEGNKMHFIDYDESKHDAEKPRLDLIPTSVYRSLGAVLTFGAVKYGANTWQGVECERYVAALLPIWTTHTARTTKAVCYTLSMCCAMRLFSTKWRRATMPTDTTSPCTHCAHQNGCHQRTVGGQGCAKWQRYFRARWTVMRVEYWKKRALQKEVPE